MGKVIGLTESVKINGNEVVAKIDTGARHNSISEVLAEKFNLGPVVKTVVIKTSNGREKRGVVRANLEIKNKKFKTFFNITDRSHMKYDVLIGLDILKLGFLVNPSKKGATK